MGKSTISVPFSIAMLVITRGVSSSIFFPHHPVGIVRQATLDRMREYGIRGSAVTYGTIVKAGVKTMGDMDRMQKNAGFTVGLAVFYCGFHGQEQG